MAPSRGFQDKMFNVFCPSISKEDELGTKRTPPKMEIYPESLGAMLGY